jgi:leucyl/phenylalanyl-tRNA--protein transferase
VKLTPDLLLSAYAQGAFPMGDPDDGGRVAFYAPDPRAVLPLGAFHVPATLAKTVRQGRFRVAVDAGFEAVVRACAAPAPGRETTWISDEIVAAYVALHRAGFAHSVECHDEAGFAGGLYGVALGGAFFGESMVSARRDASKVALVHLVERLRAGGFVLLDTQMTTPHLARFGAVEIPRADYERRLARALRVRADWRALDGPAPDGQPGAAHEAGRRDVPGT